MPSGQNDKFQGKGNQKFAPLVARKTCSKYLRYKYCDAYFEIRKLQPIDIGFEKINNEYLLNIYIFPNLV